MGDTVNLRLARKAKARRARAAEADANRAVSGRTKAAKLADVLAANRASALLDGAKRDRTPNDR